MKSYGISMNKAINFVQVGKQPFPPSSITTTNNQSNEVLYVDLTPYYTAFGFWESEEEDIYE